MCGCLSKQSHQEYDRNNAPKHYRVTIPPYQGVNKHGDNGDNGKVPRRNEGPFLMPLVVPGTVNFTPARTCDLP